MNGCLWLLVNMDKIWPKEKKNPFIHYSWYNMNAWSQEHLVVFSCTRCLFMAALMDFCWDWNMSCINDIDSLKELFTTGKYLLYQAEQANYAGTFRMQWGVAQLQTKWNWCSQLAGIYPPAHMKAQPWSERKEKRKKIYNPQQWQSNDLVTTRIFL